MSTTINFDFSTDMQRTLSNGGVVYVVVFGATTSEGAQGHVTSTVITDFATGGAITIDGSLYSGQVFIVVSQGPQATGWGSSFANGNDLMTAVINSDTLTMQILELTLSNNPADQGDITAINYNGLNVSMAITYSDGSTELRGSALTTDQLFTAAQAAVGGTDSILQWENPTQFGAADRLMYGPAASDPQAVDPLTAWKASAWVNYVASLAQNPAALAEIQIVSMFNGGTTLQTNGMLSEYRIEFVFDPTRPNDVNYGYFKLIPVTDNGATNTYYIHIPFNDMVNNIYAQTGTVNLYDHNGSFIKTEDSFTPNNAVGTVTRVLVAGFDAGFWGAEGHSLFANGSASINLSENSNWDIGYAYGGALITGQGSATYVNHVQPASGIYFDPYAALISTHTNYYGYSYSDLLSTGGVNPQISLYDAGTSSNVSTINVTIYAPDDSANLDATYTPYTAMNSDGFVVPDGTTYDGSIIFSFSFSGGNGSSTLYQPSAETPVTLKIYDPATGTFSEVALSGTYSPSEGPAITSPWNYYVLEAGPSGSWIHQPIQNYYGNGGFALNNLPISASGATYYQLVFGAEGEQTIYNFYFDPTLPEGQQIRIDHGVEVTYTATGGNYTLNFAPGGALLYDIDTLSAPGNHEGLPGVTIVGSDGHDFINMVLTVEGQQVVTNKDDFVSGGPGDDHIAGFGGNDTLDGGSGADILSGGEGNDILSADSRMSFDNGATVDVLYGGAGDDMIFAGYGDIVDGGDGFDTVALSYIGASHGITGDTAILHKGEPLVPGAGTIQNVERFSDIALTQYDDKMVIGDQTDPATVYAWDGDDHLIGQEASITMYGGNGNDLLVGSTTDDVLYGENGDDRLIGYYGADELWGGEGADRFIFVNLDLQDRIMDFEGGRDKIDLTAIDADSSKPGHQAFTWIGESDFTGEAGQLRGYLGENNTHFIAGDVDGDGVADLLINLGSVQVSSGDFIL